MDVSSDQRAIAFARLPGLVRDAARTFHGLTGLTVVTTLGSASTNKKTCGLPSPPVHPLCATLLRELQHKGPCDAEWRKHLQSAVMMEGCRIHICPLGLRCAGVPIVLGEELLGLAKLVSDRGVSRRRFRSLVGLLEALIARPCQDLYVLQLKDEIDALQVSVSQLRRTRWPVWSPGNDLALPAAEDRNNGGARKVQTLISQVLGYLSEHYADSKLSLAQVANAVGKNEKYVAHLFAQQLGQRMRAYIITLRIRRACELLLQTSRTIEEIAHDSGYVHAAPFRQSFRRAVGVTASEYRQIFAAETRPGSGYPRE